VCVCVCVSARSYVCMWMNVFRRCMPRIPQSRERTGT